ncbi:D-alanyl-D-alanine carboxypeptidase family protein [Cellulomonas edaphi]|uniref:D-alanyl-D-alanine carboxypeptidase family protein n=1 Tax=Cellulomonas edaphi TaxID=3053468 RepID=A0ABT7S7G5_9CELL|nr:D-alanyl-D-alanine carboxypeptidase family protein [Cellulomons edaphi]MDM7831573.1 D-alanyl-D-alanine carboxypeptidase family protein [Cellulomons edaphi]
MAPGCVRRAAWRVDQGEKGVVAVGELRRGGLRRRALRAVTLPVGLALAWAGLAALPAAAAAGHDTLGPGETLTATQSLVSDDGGQVAVVERGGVLSLFGADGELRWTSGPGVPGSRLVVQDDGDVSLVDPSGKRRWHTETKGTVGAHLVVRDDGDLQVRDERGAVVWSSGTRTPPSLLDAGSTLASGAVLSSADGRHTLVMGEDGDLRLLGPDARTRWSTGTDVPGSTLALSDDGELAVRTGDGVATWRTWTAGRGATLVLQDDGDLVLVDRAGDALWNTGTALGPSALEAGSSLKVGGRLDSPDGRLTLRVDADGVRLELDGSAVWAVLPAVPDDDLRLTLRKTGDLVLKGADDAVYWTSETSGTRHAQLALDAGGAVLRAPTGQELWRADVPEGALGPGTTATDCADVSAPVPLAATVLTSTGIRVHPCMAAAIDALVGAAHADGIDLGGWGWRSNAQQRALRAQNCDAAGRCSPSTAVPGTSRHERGLAIDFTVGGRSLDYSSAGYAWMVAHASDYGLKNLPGEAWHWSVDGH